MKKNLQIIVPALLVYVACAIPNTINGQGIAFLKADNDIKNNQNSIVALTEILSELEEKYNISFSYDKGLLNDKVIDRSKIKPMQGSLKKNLTNLLKPFRLKHERFDRDIYVIYIEENFKELVKVRKISVGAGNNFSKEPAPLQKLLSTQVVTDTDIKRTVTGKVTDKDSGEPLPGVNILVKGTKIGAVTDIDGGFNLDIPDEYDILVFSFIGYTTREVSVNGRSVIEVVLAEDVQSLKEIVVVGYGTQRKGNVTGSISSVKSEDLTTSPRASTANALVGRLPGLISKQTSGMPGYDAAELSIRGFGGALIIVDGVESSFNNIDANEIESVTILKDGSASIYGSRAGNGVILVTTKRGNTGKPTITFNTSFTGQGITRMVKPPSAGQYAEMESEAWLQAGKPADQVPFTPEEIQKYFNGTDPEYPNTNWYNELIRNWAPQQQHNASVRGGTDKIKYYGFLSFLDQETMWKNNGGGYKRYNFRSNIDAEILDNLTLQLDVSSIIENRKFPLRMSGPNSKGVWQDFWTTRPIYPATLPDPTKLPFADGVGSGGVHITSNMNHAGYSKSDYQIIKGLFSLNYTFKKINGLSAKAYMNYSQAYNTGKNFSKPYKFYTYDYASDIYTLAGAAGSQATLDISKSQDRILNTQVSLNYDNYFANKHRLSALALYEATDYRSDYLSAGRVDFLSSSIEELFGGSTEGMSNNGSATEMGRESFVARLTYSFKDKYLFESTFRADASAKFPENQRWGYFPSVSLGWLLSEEDFMKGLPMVDFLKLRTSYGASGNDGVGNFQYLSGYVMSGNYNFGLQEEPALVSTGLANPLLTWEEIAIYNVGMDFSMWNRKLYGEGDIFYRERSGIPGSRIGSLPSTFGSNLPPENLNSLNDRGFELKLGTAGSVNDFSYDLSGNISWSRAKWDHYEEPDYTDPDQARISARSGKWVDRQFGYLSNGLFTSQQEIDALTFDQDQQENATLRPGDIKYKDVNDDGILDWKDQVEIGKGTTPHWMMGLNLNLRYRNFYATSLWQGAMGYYNQIVLTYKVGNLMRPAIIYDLRWTEANNDPSALEPRLGGSSTNDYSSDYRYKNAEYIRLKDFSIGYNVPKKILEKANLDELKIYLSGTNILTFDKLKKYGIDPEAPSGNQAATFYYPQQKTISLGAKISF